MSQDPSSVPSSDIVSVSAAIAAGFILGKIRLTPDHHEPPYLYPIRSLLKQMEKHIGKDKLGALLKANRPFVHAVVDGLFDRVTGRDRQETKAKISALSGESRMIAESIIAEMTGKSRRNRDVCNPQWNDHLYGLKQRLEHISSVSMSNLTTEDIRKGYDPLIHAVIDIVCDNWEKLID